jgi:pyruvate/2-oxoglutarate dehydrogenase complex dihydrolipoamide dehydrogenase (E3) component
MSIDDDPRARWRQLVFPDDHVNPEPKRRYHLVVIGAGPAGLVVAIAAAGLGADVALVEREHMGGDCLNVGCVPSKGLLEAAHAGQDFASAFDWLRRVRADIAHHDSVERYRQAGVDVFLGEARFLDGSRVEVAGKTLRGRRTVIATGARAAVPPIPGLAECDPLTNETVFELDSQPRRIAILGAGPIGCELAQGFAELGTDVELFEMAPHVLPREHPEAAAVVAERLEALGVRLHLATTVGEFRRTASGCRVAFGVESIEVDRVLVATGRRTNVEALDLDRAGVRVNEQGLVEVDARLRTTNRRIFAAGDVCSELQFTHHADAQARIVIQNALFAPTARADKLLVPRCTYTSPEVAQLGLLPSELDAAGTEYDRYRVDWSELDRGRTRPGHAGFAEILTVCNDDEILGATLVGEDAGELIAPVALAMSRGIGLGGIGGTVLPYPTRSEYLRKIADQYNRTRLTPLVASLMRGWLKIAR